MLGIIGAMEIEVAKIREQITDGKMTRRAGMEFYTGIWHGKEVTVVRSGIGKVNAGICAQILIDLFEVDAIINTGIAGSLKSILGILFFLKMHFSMMWMQEALAMLQESSRR